MTLRTCRRRMPPCPLPMVVALGERVLAYLLKAAAAPGGAPFLEGLGKQLPAQVADFPMQVAGLARRHRQGVVFAPVRQDGQRVEIDPAGARQWGAAPVALVD